MPVQRTFFGRAVTVRCRMLPRRIVFALGVIGLFAVFSLLVNVPTNPASPTKHPGLHLHAIPNLKIPGVYNPFGPATHAPPVMANSSSGEDSWLGDWKWLNPFSSTTTLDESRAVLPHLRKRPYIYTFYDPRVERDSVTLTTEKRLLQIWRRAWWAKGLRPVVLGPAEAMENPLYQTLQTKKLDKNLEKEITRWLAWGLMGTGIFADYLVLPMGSYNDPLLTLFRRGEFSKLTRYEGMGNAIFFGEKTAIDAALKTALNNTSSTSSSFLDVVPKSTFEVDRHHDSLAYYDEATIIKKYEVLGEKMAKNETKAEGYALLPQLINSHLHNTFQNIFSSGIVVLKPNPEHTTALVEPALRIAKHLAQCPESPMPTSCPPNRGCNPCVSSHPLSISTPQIFQNESDIYTIGTVPHPYTFISLTSAGETISVAFIRRKTDRDPWILGATKKLAGAKVGGEPRLIKLKEAIAGEWGSSRSLWLTPEKDPPETLDWRFGFALPTKETPQPTATPPAPSTAAKTPAAKGTNDNTVIPTAKELEREREQLKRARDAVRSRSRHQQAMKAALEAWNLADTEAWRFASAYRARGEKEYAVWEEEERKYMGGSTN
ncbi:MAG: hypothetical protein M1840_004751 [Geoglossum simile]|nr:MAG: hypothetical protein M1840_004751 [Geoglossum simile]